MPIVKIMHNKKSTGLHDRWRLLINGVEYLVAGVNIDNSALPLKTSSEVNGEGNLIYFLECECEQIDIINNVAMIK